ncbi:ATP-binding protein [Labilibaculum sp.]|uniref:sensor histidine kinase n=1 Tax=Labilibaculum sp. TaxID=2060723 RepID=UPI00356817D4
MIKKILSFFILLIVTGSLFAQTPFIRNFYSKEYKAELQNWALTQDYRGVMYFGNNNSVLEYDGVNWRKIGTPGIVRSLDVDNNGRIFVGLGGDLGFLQADEIGVVNYVSLLDKIPEEHREFNYIDETIVANENVFFRTKGKIFILKENSISVLQDERFAKSFLIRDTLYISVIGEGIMYYEGDDFQLLPGSQKFVDKRIQVMLPYGKDKILCYTVGKGIEFFAPNESDGAELAARFEKVSKIIDEARGLSGTVLPNGDFAIGTITNGILVFDKWGRIKNHYRQQNGLQNNSALELSSDINGQLWAALLNGISLVHDNLPFLDYSQQDNIKGPILCVQDYHDRLYVGTEQFLYVKNRGGKFKPVEGLKGQNFHLHKAKDKLLLARFLGIFEIKEEQATLIPETENMNAYVFCPLAEKSNYLLSGLHEGLLLLEYKNDQWKYKHHIKGFDKPVYTLTEDTDGNFWAFTFPQLYKLRLNENLDSVTFVQNCSTDKYNLPAGWVVPYQLNSGETVFGTQKNGVYRYIPSKNKFEPHPDFSMIKGGVYPLVQDKNGYIWFDELKKDGTYEKGFLKWNNGKYESYKTPFYKFNDRNIPNTFALYPYSDSLVYFGTDNGLLAYFPKQKVNYDIPFNTLIRKVFVSDSLIYGGAENNSSSISNEPVILEYKKNNLYFHYSATFYEDSEKNLFSYRLRGSSDTMWSAWTNDHKKEYTNLNEGRYIFEVKSQNVYQKSGAAVSFPFEVLPPWYRTLWAYALYVILLSIFVWLLIRLNSARLKYQNELLKHTVEERTANILQQKEEIQVQAEELKVTNEKLVEINATKDKFFSIISHDLRSPFTSILGFADLLNNEYDTIDDAEKREMINDLNKSSRHAYNMLANLLSWARSQTGRIEICKESLDLKELVKKSIAPYLLNASGKKIKIVNNVPSEIMFSIDKNTFLTFMGNLVNNAIKFTPEGGTITINYHENSDDIELHVIDNGVGMTPESIEKLFRIDQNICTNGTKGEKGTGLGLILCKEFIEKNGGNISVRSEVGKGSEFIITLPK